MTAGPRMDLEGLSTQGKNPDISHHLSRAKRNRKVLAAGTAGGHLLLTAQRIAEELGQHGVVTMDDVTRKMIDGGNDSHAVSRLTPKNWKGAVFGGGKWVPVGHKRSNVVSNQARSIAIWALKSWLERNPVNGESYDMSAFSVSRLFADVRRRNPGIGVDDLEWFLGHDGLSEGIRRMINSESAQNPSRLQTLMGIRVSWSRGTGAILAKRTA